MPIRIGVVDFDSSHCVEFTRRINHVDIGEDHWVEGARVVVGCPVRSLLSPERVPGFTAQMKSYGIALVERPADMIGTIDAVLVLSVDGSVHLERVRPFLEAGLPCFVDKPLTCSLAEARVLVDLAERRRAPLFSASALRFAAEVVDFVAQSRGGESATGATLGAAVYGPAPVHARNPGLFHYGIHATEMLFALLGSGCDWVTCVREGGEPGCENDGVDSVTGRWHGGRVGSVRGIRSGTREYGFVAFCQHAVRHVAVSTEYVYRELLKQVIQMFETGRPALAAADTLEIIAFIEAALASGRRGGSPTRVEQA